MLRVVVVFVVYDVAVGVVCVMFIISLAGNLPHLPLTESPGVPPPLSPVAPSIRWTIYMYNPKNRPVLHHFQHPQWPGGH